MTSTEPPAKGNRRFHADLTEAELARFRRFRVSLPTHQGKVATNAEALVVLLALVDVCRQWYASLDRMGGDDYSLPLTLEGLGLVPPA